MLRRSDTSRLCFSVQVLDNAIETEKMIEKYESLASDLLEWIEQTIIILNNRKFANSLVGVQQQLQAFNTYRTVEKPPKLEPLPSSPPPPIPHMNQQQVQSI